MTSETLSSTKRKKQKLTGTTHPPLRGFPAIIITKQSPPRHPGGSEKMTHPPRFRHLCECECECERGKGKKTLIPRLRPLRKKKKDGDSSRTYLNVTAQVGSLKRVPERNNNERRIRKKTIAERERERKKERTNE